MNEITIGNINYTIAKVDFPEYETLLSQAKEIANMIDNADVNEETIKEVKKLLSEANKSLKKLDSERIKIKKAITVGYDSFEAQCQQIKGIVADAESRTKAKVKELEEKEKAEKLSLLKGKFDSYRDMLGLTNYVEFESMKDWEKLLNKSVSNANCNKAIGDFLDSVKGSIDVINSMEDSIEILDEYLKTFNLPGAIVIVNDRKERKRILEEQAKKIEKIVEEADDHQEFDIEFTEEDILFDDLELEEPTIEILEKALMLACDTLTEHYFNEEDRYDDKYFFSKEQWIEYFIKKAEEKGNDK